MNKIRMREILKVLLIALCHFQSCVATESSANQNNCKQVHPDRNQLQAFIGWPFKILCSLPLTSSKSTIDISKNAFITCLISTSQGALLYNTTSTYQAIEFSKVTPGLLLSDLNPNNNYSFHIRLNVPENDSCYKANVTLNLTNFPEETCENFTKNYSFRPWGKNVGSSFKFSCELGHSTYPKLYVNYSDKSTTARWLRNCSDLPVGITPIRNQNSLLISPVTFDHAGIYICEVTHNGMTRYVTAKKVCVEHSSTVNEIIFYCSKNYYLTQIGRNVTANCEINMGDGYFDHIKPIFWSKDNASKISCNEYGGWSSKQRPHASCSYKMNKTPCFLHVASTEERQPNPYIVTVQLVITNIEASDFGSYTIQTISAYSETKTATFVISEEKSSHTDPNEWSNLTLIVIISLGILLVIVFIIVVFISCRRKYYAF